MYKIEKYSERIETKRLIIRPFHYGDEHEILEFVQINGERLKENIGPWLNEVKEEKDVSMYIKKMKIGRKVKKIFTFGIWLKSDQTFIGEVFLFHIHQDSGDAEIGINLGGGFEGKGYATEAFKACLDLAFFEMGLKKIVANCGDTNISSQNLMLRSGFQLDCVAQGVHKFSKLPTNF